MTPKNDDIQAGNNQSKNAAADLIRQKVNSLFDKEPNTQQELSESENQTVRSKHQQFMYDLSISGKSLADIQTAWHNYYLNLPDNEKHEVWQEFYREHDRINQPKNIAQKSVPTEVKIAPPKTRQQFIADQKSNPHRSVGALKKELLSRVGPVKKITKKQHLNSLFFGLSMGMLIVVVLLFSFFNERFIAPFITPSKSVSATPIIIDPNSTAVGPEPKIIIPKINVELPVDFTATSIDETAVDSSLEKGVLHYPTTSMPGELGNGAIFGHSSNNILNKGKFKFAFVLLKRLDTGDTFMIQYKSKRFIYKVYDKKIVKPTDVSVLGNTDKPATFALITCDPPGTSLNRLVVWGEQISPDVSSNTASTAIKSNNSPAILPSNSPSLWQHFWHWLSS